ncbi:aminotransferase class V-fold PLP-dependent enzyme [Hominenteromicrobium sp.]|uniref:aminotransferase class V-fold PLP-dependent enzyme n=1 Tax=Hominenteromicrobium sp. TaxID=3073581 RepID=UPI003AB5C070
MIYLDNSATTYPKPLSVRRKMAQALEQFGANPGRGGFKMSLQTAQAVYDVRQKAARFFGAAGPECISFQPSCTQSLNIVIHSLKRGDHVLVTDLEHNAVLRPLKAMEAHGVSFTVVPVTPGDNDAAQSGGVIPIHAERDGIDYLCCAGHKGLYGPMGTGMLITKNGEKLESLIQGGTGTRALELDQPREMPEYLESGTQNVPGILALGAGMDFVRTNGEYMLREREMRHIRRVYEAFKNMPHVILYTAMPDTMYFVPVLGFNVRGMQSEEVGEVLAKRNIAVRCGLHCAPLVHRKMGTDGETPGGAVRVSPGAFTTDRDITELIRTVYSLRAESAARIVE